MRLRWINMAGVEIDEHEQGMRGRAGRCDRLQPVDGFAVDQRAEDHPQASGLTARTMPAAAWRDRHQAP
jgi:hypothetical protein